jgi:protein phosphatase
MKLTIPEFSLVVLIGASGSGKSTFARKHFKPTEILSSDFCRGLLSDNENDQAVTKDAFEVLRFIAAKRLAAGKLTIIDATNVKVDDRKPLLALAHEYHCLPVAIVFNLPPKICQGRNLQRPDRDFGPHVVRQQCQQLRRSLRNLQREGFRYVFILPSPEEVEAASIERQPLWNNLKHEQGPFDIIGDVHGCFDELVILLQKLGYEIIAQPDTPDHLGYIVRPPDGRKVIFVGDLVDRGPNTPEVLRLAMRMVNAGIAFCIPGNHDMKLLRALKGRNVQVTHGLAESLAQLEQESPEFKAQVVEFLDGLVSHYVLDAGRLVVAHAGMKEELQGRASGQVRDFALYGETTGETDDFGLPIRHNWAEAYRGKAMVVYGHTPVPEAEWLNRTINIDTGCVFGGKLTALRYPEKELVSVPALHTYYQLGKPFLAQAEQSQPLTEQRKYDDLLDIEDVLGQRIISTRLRRNVTIREENAIVALEVMSRFAANPKWLIYLPPTMSPTETANQPGLLEHPAEAFDYYRRHGVSRVICEEKHMGSRAVVIVCRDEEAARKRFGVVDEGFGICYTRTGRHFFNNRELEADLLARVQSALETADMWHALNTDWVCLDCELMPWSVKAQELLRQQYAAVGASSRAALGETVTMLEQAAERGVDVSLLLDCYRNRVKMVNQYVDAYRRYCWPVRSVTDLKLAPFHLLATEGVVHVNRAHTWHIETLAKLCRTEEQNSSLLLATPYKVVDITDPASQNEGIGWWEELTSRGGEGVVIKPFDFIVKGKGGIIQPAIKCRGQEYLRIIYGPEYTMPENLERLRSRSLSTKRSLALKEFALGVEALERFVRQEPLYRVHECVFGILALESEPVDPRL